jgi:hypothetical protein
MIQEDEVYDKNKISDYIKNNIKCTFISNQYYLKHNGYNKEKMLCGDGLRPQDRLCHWQNA